MTTLLMLPGRFGGVNIDHTEFRSLREAADKGSRSIFEKAWTVIKDWFCGTKADEAKDCLFALYSSKTTDEEKYLAFSQLKELVSFSYKSRFVERDDVDGTSIWIHITHDAAIFKHTIVSDVQEEEADPMAPLFSSKPFPSFDSHPALSLIFYGRLPSSTVPGDI